MASLELRNKTYRVVFMHAGKKHGFSLDTGDRQTAEALRGGVEKTLMLMGQGALRLPDGADFLTFVKTGGQTTDPPKPAPDAVPLGVFCDRYLAAHSGGAMEANSLATVGMHLGHFVRTLGARFSVGALALEDLQRHVDERRKKRYRGKTLSPVTLRKEVASFRAAWNWGVVAKVVSGPFPSNGLVYPKGDEKPPYMTRAEVERKLPGLSAAEATGLWECLYLRKEEINELLSFVKDSSGQPWIYPMVATAALTGARRSELLRAEVADVDLGAETLLVREKKRSKKQRTTRHVSLTPLLKAVLAEWLVAHPGGRFLFCQSGVVNRSKTRSRTTGHQSGESRAKSQMGRTATVKERGGVGITPVTKDEAHDHLKRTLAGSKWEVMRGYHVLRHSFISCLAAAGVDQRIIDDFVGHSTPEQQRRYRHLIPDVKQKAIAGVFG
jgi:integrase